jgi:hypothetical protein
MDLGTAVNDIGRLIGVLSGTSQNVAFQGDWFQDPVGNLESAQTRLDCLADLVGVVMGPGVSSAPDVFPDACWYTVPDPISLAATPFCVVASPGTDASGQIGGGVLQQVTLGTVTVSAYGYFPLFSYDSTGATLVAGTDPLRIGVYATSTVPFTSGPVTFTAMDLEACIYLSSTTPTFTLTFEGMQGQGDAPTTYTSLDALLDPTVEGWIAAVIVQGQSWLNTIVAGEITVGQLLVAAGFLTTTTTTQPDGDTTTVYDVDLSQLQGKTAEQIALGLVFQVMDALAAVDFPVISLPGGGVFVAHDPVAQTYGIRVQAQVDLAGGSETATGGTGGGGGGTGTTDAGNDDAGNTSTAPPGFAVQLALGTWFTGETDAANWVTATGAPPVDGGITLNLLQGDAESCTFAPSFLLTSVGVTVSGVGDAPLVSTGGVTIGGAELRASYDPATGGYGFGARLDAVGFPLGPAFPGGAGGNPVAQNVLASGDDPAQAGQASAASPTFSAEASYVSGYNASFELIDAQGTPGGVVWFPVQRRYGPLSVQKIGVKVDTASSPVLDLLFDGGVELGGLSVYLDQLSIGVPLEDIDDPSGYSLDLQGLDVTFTGPGVEISGGLLKMQPAGGGVEYDGQALIKAGDLAINALGSYSTLEGGGTSLFIFAWLNAPLGGPACFYVTGLAAGFGYNRSLRIPAQNEVQNFPLVAGLSNPALLGGGTPTPAAALTALESWVPPERGEYWLAAGVQFSTFEVVNTNALLVVEFGQELTVAVLGISTLKQPLTGDAWVYAELDIEAVLQPQQGEFRASAVLAPSSYVIVPQAHLTGGFAFAAWWGPNPNAGDFVFTLGGYHPAFDPPDYYPQVPRLGINWQFDSSTSLVGGAYFALTPTAMMAGASLQLTFSEGNLKAWLKAQCDAILFWKPFYFIATASISVGVSYRISLFGVDQTLSVEIGAQFGFWGPPVGFRVHVDWYIISFTIGSGKPNPPSDIDWTDFKGLLPTKTQVTSSSSTATTAMTAMTATADAATADVTGDDSGTTTTEAYLTINVTSGLKTSQVVDGLTIWLVRPGQFAFSVASAIPASQLAVQGNGDSGKNFTGNPVALRNVNGGIPSSDYQSTQTVAVLSFGTASVDALQAAVATDCSVNPANIALEDLDGWAVDALNQGLPQAMWGDPVPRGQQPDINAPVPTVSGTVGVTMAPLPPDDPNCTPQMVIDQVFADRTVNSADQYGLPISAAQTPCPTPPVVADSFDQIAHVNDPDTAGQRAALFDALTVLGISGWTNDPLPQMAATPGQDFADEPLEGTPVCAAP